MNRRIFWAVFLALAVGCQESSQPPLGSDKNAVQPPFAVARSTVPRETASVESLVEQQAASINAFAVAMFRYFGSQGAANIFFSPYSIAATLAMTEAGARGETQAQIRRALFTTLPGDELHAAMNGLDISLTAHAQATGGVNLNIINSTWVQSGWNFNASYLDLLSRYYGSGVNLLDFVAQPDSSRIIINNWVAQQTNQRIKNLIPADVITSDTRLVLTNAIWFLAEWLFRFDSGLTTNETFTKLDNSTVQVPLMKLGGTSVKVRMRYARVGSVRAVDLPYRGGRLCMTVLLPDGGSYAAFEESLSIAKVNEILTALDSTDLSQVRLPKFTFTSGSVSLRPVLISLGVVDAFDAGRADFSGIDGRRDMVLSDVIHKAFIAVDEKGTEAAAATASVIGITSVPVDIPMFVADRPFIFLIRDRLTSLFIFMGRILDPTVRE